MSITTYQLIHVISAFLLCAFTFMACATASVGKNKRIMMLTGILSFTMLVGGFGLAARLELDIAKTGWILVKIAAWLVLSMAAGFAYRKPGKAGTITAAALIAIVVAICMVYLRPF